MNSELSLRLLRAILPESPWTEDRFTDLMRELRVLADHKYNKYEMYQPGRLFFESLFLFLSRLQEADRTPMLDFIRKNLTFISRDEFQQLAHILHYDQIRQRHLDMVSAATTIPRHRLAALKAAPELARIQRASLYVGMSDGARIDYFRRHNLDINNEQVLTTYDPGTAKLKDLSAKLAEDLGENGAKFDCVFLLDDFCGSGRTLAREVVTSIVDADIGALPIPPILQANLSFDPSIRQLTWQYRGPVDEAAQTALRAISTAKAYQSAIDDLVGKAGSRTTEIKGAFAKIAKTDLVTLISDRARLFFCPLLATDYAIERLDELVRRSKPPLNRIELLPAAVIPDSERIVKGAGPIADICERYHASTIGDEHTGDVTFGYDGCGLAVVLHHNTPNNSVYWLWARKWTDPLFVRYERHGREVNT